MSSKPIVTIHDRLFRSREAWYDDPQDGLVIVVCAYGTFKLNASASFIWRRCDGQHTIDAIINQVLIKVDLNYATVYRDIIEFIDMFLKIGLLRIGDTGSSFDNLPIEPISDSKLL